jgi:hypothetical protein
LVIVVQLLIAHNYLLYTQAWSVAALMSWTARLKSRFGFIYRHKAALSPKRIPAQVTFPRDCPLRPAVEPAHPASLVAYLESQGNRPERIERLARILQMDTLVLELGCGNAEIAWQIASKNPSVGVVATDIYRSPCLSGAVLGYAKASRAWTNGLLKAQILAPDNLVILRAGACLLSLLPPQSITTLLLVNPEPAVGRAFLNLLAESQAHRAVRPGPKQLVIKPFSKKMGVTTCGGFEFNTEADWSRGIGFLRESPFDFQDAPRTHWQVDLGAFSDYSKNSTQTGVSVCGDINPPPTIATTRVKGSPACRPVRRLGRI